MAGVGEPDVFRLISSVIVFCTARINFSRKKNRKRDEAICMEKVRKIDSLVFLRKLYPEATRT